MAETNGWFGRWCTVVVVSLVFVVGADRASAQKQGVMPAGIKLSPSVGEEIEVYYLGDWRPGKVMDVSRNQVVVEYEFANNPRRREFPLHETRYAWQAKVISPVYNWKDQSGSFSIKAAVVDFDQDENTVTLYRLDKGSEITVPVSKLSDADQRRLELIGASAPLRNIAAPKLETFATAALNSTAAWDSATDISGVSPDPPAIAVSIPSGGAVFPKSIFGTTCCRCIRSEPHRVGWQPLRELATPIRRKTSPVDLSGRRSRMGKSIRSRRLQTAKC
ncbi:hypothetical protein C2E31_22640 [Rhodopirellula baltica]|nr:hypothetical protein C2E31_22640 [Rhodopirellula baltica]